MKKYVTVECTSLGISRCVESVRNGGVIVFPTDTVYGLGCDPYNEAAVTRVFALKSRVEQKPLPVLVGSLDDASRLVDLGPCGLELARKYWPGKLTIVAPLVDDSISPRITGGTGKLGVRIPSNVCSCRLLKECRFLVGTSANISGEPACIDAASVARSGLDGFDILIDGGRTGGGESTIFDITNSTIIREGAIRSEDLYKAIGKHNQ